MPASTTPDADGRAERQSSSNDRPSSPVRIGSPGPDDGPALWRLARDSGELDLNSPYAYLIWCRDFSETSVVARDGREPVGFITGYRRPEVGEVLFVWQVAVDPAYRGQRIGVRMLDAIGAAAKRLGCRYVEATVTPDNTASLRMFSSFARTLGAPLTRTEGFDATQFPDHHQPEDLIRIGPL
jgi:L-2,4-diaminobutyric acid acetyltransferase